MVRLILVIFSSLLLSSLSARADVLFEGYSKILSGEDHIGYVINRYEFDPKTKTFISTYLMKTGKGPTEATESLKAIANSKLAPISYQYTSLAGKDSKTIDAKFKGTKLSAVVKVNGRIQRIEKPIPNGIFLSTFLVYMMLKSKKGIQAGEKYEYQALAEEDAAIYTGEALTNPTEETFQGVRVLRVRNTFKDSKFLAYINDRGEVLGTNALGQAISTELVANAAEATANQSYSASILKTLFGNVPAGQDNVKFRAAKLKENEARAEAEGAMVPPGQGVIIKSNPQNEESGTIKGKGR